MVQLIVGNKGKGKTKYLLDKVNNEVKAASGSIVYLDKNSKHMYELNNKVRLIDCSRFPLTNSDEFIGFICGILSQDHDLELMYLDSFLCNAKLEENGDQMEECIDQLENIGNMFNVTFVLSVSKDKEEFTEELQDKIVFAL